MTASGVGSSTEYHLRIGIDPAFYAQRIPAALQNGAVVKIFPLLFQMGVDIRQWGANAGMGDEKKWIQKKHTVRSNEGRLIFYYPTIIFVGIIVLWLCALIYIIVFGPKKADNLYLLSGYEANTM